MLFARNSIMFSTWVPLVGSFLRLRSEQAELGWSVKRETSIVYANEADVLNMALFGFTAEEWRESNPTLPGNVRDYASVNQLICLSNMESQNSGMESFEKGGYSLPESGVLRADGTIQVRHPRPQKTVPVHHWDRFYFCIRMQYR